jgi:hypothetical protein
VFGGGIDTRTVVHVLKIPIGFRIEVRDFYSGLPTYNQKVTGNLQNNLAFTGGLLIRFEAPGLSSPTRHDSSTAWSCRYPPMNPASRRKLFRKTRISSPGAFD